MESLITDIELRSHAVESLRYANSYLTILERSLKKKKSRFNNELLYQLAIMSFEKYFVALLAHYGWNASHHMPVALYKEALLFEKQLPDTIRQTAVLVGKFEGICSLSDFGYHTPCTEELEAMLDGMKEIQYLVESRMNYSN